MFKGPMIPAGGGPAAPAWLSVLSGRSGGFALDRRFSPDALAGAPLARAEAERDQAAAAAEAEARRAIDEAFAAGLSQGRSEGEGRLAAERFAHERLRLSITRLDEGLRRELAERLAETVTALCGTALAPLALDRQALQRRSLAAARLLGEAQEQLELHLHPDDIAGLDPDFAAGWTIVPQPGFERGTLRIEGQEAGAIDGPAEWRAALETALAC